MSPFPHPKPLPSSYWLKSIKGRIPTISALPSAADIVVIGTGISGASTVFHLAERFQSLPKPTPLRILLLDARDISGGATGRNGGLMWPGLLDSWPALAGKYGRSTAAHLIRFDLDNCHATAKTALALNKACTPGDPADPCLYFYPKGGVNLLYTEDEVRSWKENIAAMQAEGCPEWGVTMWSEQQTRQLVPNVCGVIGAVHNKYVWRMRSGRLVASLLNQAKRIAADSNGLLQLDVSTYTRVDRVEAMQSTPASKYALNVMTEKGNVSAGKVVYCTNAYSSALLPTVDITPVKNQVVVTNELKVLPWDCAIKAHSGYDYLSSREDNRVVLGGMRYLAPGFEVGNSNDGVLDPVVSNALKTFMPTECPEVKSGDSDGTVKVQEEWAGIMGFTSDHMPLVGPIPNRKNELICAGFSGHGIARAFLCGKAVADMTLGVDATNASDVVDLPAVFLPRGRFDKPKDADPSKLVSKM
ncbi:hypothetical protein QVD99_003893 [Batrachochytrium dendrobatidis]|nr:hypothetical protein O5D80_002170 [Batrachochytrium dendrobatidis]KAK5669499.1 hypothetical protein QVD99_003893 [Batrachochytrium dendrobatidis]